MCNENLEKIGQAVDGIENLAAGLNLPLPPQMHIDQLKKILPEIANQIKEAFIAETGENPWE